MTMRQRNERNEGSYRDETASLVAENARLRAELERIRHPRRRLGAAAGLVAFDVVVGLGLRPWFNGGNDAKFWLACAVVALLALGAAWFAFGAYGTPRRAEAGRRDF
jgi:hypothetical protein